MEVIVNRPQTVKLRTLSVIAGVRYWEDATVDGVEDTEGNLIPCRSGDKWIINIDLDSGIIRNWKKGVKADIHYKICDDGVYILEDIDGNEVLRKENCYVPKILCPEENGYGDYIIMKVDPSGQILNYDNNIDDILEIEN